MQGIVPVLVVGVIRAGFSDGVVVVVGGGVFFIHFFYFYYFFLFEEERLQIKFGSKFCNPYFTLN